MVAPRGREWLTGLCCARHLQALWLRTYTQATRLATAPRHTEFVASITVCRLVHIFGRLPPVRHSRVTYFEGEWFSPARPNEPQNKPGKYYETHTDDEQVLWLSGPEEHHLQRLQLEPHKRQRLINILLSGERLIDVW